MKVNIGPYTDGDSDRTIEIEVDKYDHWNADHTISLIALPILQQLRECQQGAPYVELDDVPEELHPEEGEVEPYKTDSTHFERWNWVLDEMIYALDYIANDREFEGYEEQEDSDSLFGFRPTDAFIEKGKKESKRVQRGFELFGKYFQALWS